MSLKISTENFDVTFPTALLICGPPKYRERFFYESGVTNPYGVRPTKAKARRADAYAYMALMKRYFREHNFRNSSAMMHAYLRWLGANGALQLRPENPPACS